MTDFGRPEPWVEEERRQMQMEIEEERWLYDRPECPICHEKVGRGDIIDLSQGDMEEGYVYHAECFQEALRKGFGAEVGSWVDEVLEADYGRNADYDE